MKFHDWVFGSILLSMAAVFGVMGFYANVRHIVPLDIQKLRTETVLIDMKNGQGSGFIVNGTEIITAKHVTVDAGKDPITVEFFNGEKVTAIIEWQSKDADVAILSVKVPAGYSFAPTACRAPVINENIIAVGSPMYLRWVTSNGHVLTDRAPWMPSEAPQEAKDQANTLVPFDAVVAPGSSGGPVFDAEGKVIGLVDAIMEEVLGHDVQTIKTQTSTINFMVPSKFFCGSELKKV